MGVWVQRDGENRAEPAAAARVALALLGHRSVENLEPLLASPIPAVDGLILSADCRIKRLSLPCEKLRQVVSVREMTAGRLAPAFLQYDHALWLRPGDTLLIGHEPMLIRRVAQRTDRSCLIPVHYPLRSGLTLVGLEPRWVSIRQGLSASPGFVRLPVESERPPSEEPQAQREETASALLLRAIRALSTGDREAGFAMLDHLYGQTAKRLPAIAGLAVRNGIAAALSVGSDRWTDLWADRAEADFRGYAEAELLCSLIPLFRGDAAKAVEQLTRLVERPEHAQGIRWISGGGETTYRALTFRGQAFAERGDLNGAVDDWAAALQANPDYLLPLERIARHRLHAEVLDRLGLRRHMRGRPPKAMSLAARAYAQSSHPETVPRRPVPRQSSRLPEAVGVQWEGPFFTASSLARVNREIAARLLEREWNLGAVPTEPQSYDPASEKRFHPLAERQWYQPAQPAITVRHRWPPAFAPTGTGRLVLFLPWEYGAVPRTWVTHLEQVDEIWVYSDWVRRGVISSGIEPERVHIVPCGVDPRVFCPGPDPSPAEREDFRFLYVGGTIPRKGYDLALHAFLHEFAADEPVMLTVKDFGSDTFYRGSSGIALVRAAEAATINSRRRVQVIDEVLTDEGLSDLYRSADCLLAPYRAEGFCLPALEAMACGTPAILPKFGPALDYARPDTVLLIEAGEQPIGDRIEGMHLAGEGVVCLVSVEDLRYSMRWAFEHRAELQRMGLLASADVHARFTWNHATRVAEQRLKALLPHTTFG